MKKKHIVYVLVTPSYKQNFSAVRYGNNKKAKEAAEEAGRVYMVETGKTCIIHKKSF